MFILMTYCTYCASGGPASDPGRLSSTDVTVGITVLASNSPYGVYMFTNGSLHVSIAEDSSNESVDTRASLLVQKMPGAAGYSQVMC